MRIRVRNYNKGDFHICLDGKRGRKATSFSKTTLMIIAFHLDIANDQGFDKTDSAFFGCLNSLQLYKVGWLKRRTKKYIAQNIWNRVAEIGTAE